MPSRGSLYTNAEAPRASLPQRGSQDQAAGSLLPGRRWEGSFPGIRGAPERRPSLSRPVKPPVTQPRLCPELPVSFMVSTLRTEPEAPGVWETLLHERQRAKQVARSSSEDNGVQKQKIKKAPHPTIKCSERTADIISTNLDQDAIKKEYSENICTEFLAN